MCVYVCGESKVTLHRQSNYAFHKPNCSFWNQLLLLLEVLLVNKLTLDWTLENANSLNKH